MGNNPSSAFPGVRGVPRGGCDSLAALATSHAAAAAAARVGSHAAISYMYVLMVGTRKYWVVCTRLYLHGEDCIV